MPRLSEAMKSEVAGGAVSLCSQRAVRAGRRSGRRAAAREGSTEQQRERTDLDEDALAAAGLGEPALVAPLAEEVERVVEVGHGKT